MAERISGGGEQPITPVGFEVKGYKKAGENAYSMQIEVTDPKTGAKTKQTITLSFTGKMTEADFNRYLERKGGMKELQQFLSTSQKTAQIGSVRFSK